MNSLDIYGENLVVLPLIYVNGRIAIQITTEHGEPYCTLSSNVVEAVLLEDEFCVPSWNIPHEFLEKLLAVGIFQDTGKLFPTARVVAPVWRLSCPEMLEKVLQLRLDMKADSCESVI